jgi:6,7-dimethyl-8-ribityllumazine synthase
MAKITEGKLMAKGLKIALVASRFNEFITGKLLEGALDALKRHDADEKDLAIFKVPGSWEIPYAASKLAKSKKFDAIVCLGAIIKGDTTHNEYIAAEVSKGIAAVSLESGIPVAFGVLTTDNLEQAIDRAGTKSGNKGAEAAMSAVEMANLYKNM